MITIFITHGPEELVGTWTAYKEQTSALLLKFAEKSDMILTNIEKSKYFNN